MTKHSHDLRIKRVYEPPSKDDGQRVRVDRLWPRGLNKHEAAVDVWLKDVAPTARLRKWFGHKPARWHEFRERYLAELTGNAAVEQLLDMAAAGQVTLLYGAHDEEHNQARVLIELLNGKDDRPHGKTRP